MKPKIITTLRNCLVLATMFSVSNAQGESFDNPPRIDIIEPAPTPRINTKVDRVFLGYFKDATNIRWYEIKNKFVVKFTLNDQENRALFTKNGQLVYHIIYGTEAFLPANVRRIVKSEYYDQKITRVLKVNQDHRIIWVVHLEDDKEYIMARVEDGELEETKRMEK